MTNEEVKDELYRMLSDVVNGGYPIRNNTQKGRYREAVKEAIKALEQEPCDDVCEWFEQYVDIATDIVELRFSDGTVKRAKRGLYMRDIEKSIRKMLIDQIANEKKQDVLDKIREEIHATAEMHEDGDYYLRDEWIDEIIDKYKAESEDNNKNLSAVTTASVSQMSTAV